MTRLPFSDVTLIAASLGGFFLIVAFYKSIFHRRKSKTQSAGDSQKEAAAARENQPVKLSDPFQQISIDSLPQSTAQKSATTPFYPAYPPSANGHKTISAFRPFQPNKEFDSAAGTQKAEGSYKWE